MVNLCFAGSGGPSSSSCCPSLRQPRARPPAPSTATSSIPTIAPCPGAHIVVESTNTAATRDVVSNQQGLYSVPALPPDPYNITVEANGFKTFHQTGIVLEADQQARMDFALTIGSRTETVTVEGSTPLLNTSDATVSTLIGNQFVDKHALERAQLQHAHQSGAGSGADADQYKSSRASSA